MALKLQDTHQNFWQLASVTGTALGLPATIIAGQLAVQYGPGTALLSVLVGNFIHWLIGLAIISMTVGRNQAIENIRGYLGNTTSLVASLVWICAFIIWYSIQIKWAANTVSLVFPNFNLGILGGILGITAALLSRGGILLIKHFCVICLPLLLFFSIYIAAASPQVVIFQGTWGISFSAVITIIAVWLPGIVNLPTFFRHSRSKADSLIAISLTVLFHAFFQITSIFAGISGFSQTLPEVSATPFLLFLFAIPAYLCCNLLNIYYASAGWETIHPSHQNTREYLIIGLIGTLAFVLSQGSLLSFQNSLPMERIENLLSSFIGSSGIVLLIDFLIRLVVRHRPRPYEKLLSSLCWLGGCISSIIVQTYHSATSNQPLIIGMLTSALLFLVLVFVEETLWSMKKVSQRHFLSK